MLILVRCNDVASDPRAMKYVNYLRANNKLYKLIAWDRDGRVQDESEGYFLKKRAGYNVGGIKAVLNRIIWMWFVLKRLIKMKEKAPVIHACDLDAAFPSAVYKVFFNKKSKLIFDFFDWYSATLYNQGAIVLKAFAMMEKFSVKHSDKIIICEPERIEQIPYPIPNEQLLVLPNIPCFADSSFLVESDNYKFQNDLITFSYVGGFSTERCLSEIIALAEDGIINLAIAGFVNVEIEHRLERLSGCSNVKYYGKVAYTDGLNIMYNSDIIYAMYAKSNPNHIYAAPNKFYEAMFLGKPIFSTSGTIVAKKIDSLGIGFTSEESKNDIFEIIKTIDKSESLNKGMISKLMWDTEYKTYTIDFLNNEYRALLVN